MSSSTAGQFRPLRVAVVTETYPPEINGVAVTIARVVRGLRRAGHSVQVVRPRQISDGSVSAREGDEVLTRGIPIPRYPELKLGLPCGRMLTRLWRRDRPDVVHVATEGPLGWSALRTARALGITAVSEFRTNFHAYSQHYGLGCLKGAILGYLRRFHNRCDATMTPTHALAKELEDEGFERLHTVGRGVDTTLFHPGRRSEALRRRWGLGADDLAILSVGRLAPEKNLALFERACAEVSKLRPGTRVVLVGDGPCREALQRQWPTAVFAGRQSGEALAEHFASGDLLLFPSLTETFGNVTIEAIASGLGVVAFNYGAAAEVIDDQQTGWLAPRGDSDAFVRASMHAVKEPANLQRVRRAAAALAPRLGWHGVIQDLLEVYRIARFVGIPSTAAGGVLQPTAGRRTPANADVFALPDSRINPTDPSHQRGVPAADVW